MYAEVIPAKRGKITLPFFDYAVPKDLEEKIAVGQLVKIPLRTRTEFGVVRSIHPGEPKFARVKPITEIVTERPFFTVATLKFLEEISEQYFASLGLVIKSALPPLQKRKLSKVKADATDPHQKILPTKPFLHVYSNAEDRIKYIEKNIPEKGQTLIIVPEVADLENLAKPLTEKFGKKVITVSSELSTKEHFAIWFDVWTGGRSIIIGTRSALLLSFQDLKAIFVDNEAHTSHKSWDSAPRIHARDAAFIAAKYSGASLHLLSFAPSVESYFFAKHEVYQTTGISELKPIDNIEFVNMLDEKRGKNFGPFGFELEEAIKNTSGTIFLYCNRRGSASYVNCRDCAEVRKCKNCGRPMTYHESDLSLQCHICHTKEQMDQSCSKCGGVNLVFYGLGTEAIAKAIKDILPNDSRPIITVEGDKNYLEKIKFDVDQIIIGTQLAWAHLDWENIKLLAFMDADTPLFVPEFRSAENLWQLIHEAKFRLNAEAKFFIQTTHPEHPVYTCLEKPDQFYETELKNRRAFGYPPYQFLLKIFNGFETKTEADTQMKRLHDWLIRLTKDAPDIRITPPLELFPYFAKGRFWQTIILKLPYKNYKQLSRLILRALPENWKVDPNPNTLLSL